MLTVGALLGEHPNSLDESALLARDWLIQLKGAVNNFVKTTLRDHKFEPCSLHAEFGFLRILGSLTATLTL